MVKKYTVIVCCLVLSILLALMLWPTVTDGMKKDRSKAVGILKLIKKVNLKKSEKHYMVRAFNVCENDIGYKMSLKEENGKAILFMEPYPKYEYRHENFLKRLLHFDFSKVKRPRFELRENGIKVIKEDNEK